MVIYVIYFDYNYFIIDLGLLRNIIFFLLIILKFRWLFNWVLIGYLFINLFDDSILVGNLIGEKCI